MEKLLLVDDSIPFLNDMESLLQDHFEILKASSGGSALRLLKTETVVAVLLDLKLPDMFGLEVLTRIHDEVDPLLPVIIVTDYGEAENAVKAMRNGAFDFIPKAVNVEVLAAKVLKALEHRELKLRVGLLHGSFEDRQNQYIFRSPLMRKLHYQLLQLAKNDFDVLLVGETGVGKDLSAFEIHRHSARRDQPFVPILINSLNESIIESELFGHEKGAFTGADSSKIGKLEAADGGTVYLPEISSLNEELQIKLLHFMQYKTMSRVGQNPKKSEKMLNVRLIMATNENLPQLVREGHLREDFYYRISGIKLEIPPLRKRKEDIEPLARYFLKKNALKIFDGKMDIHDEVWEMFRAYHWPGNVRELENVIKGAVAFAGQPVLTADNFGAIRQALADFATTNGELPTKFPNLAANHINGLRPPYSPESTPVSYKEAERQFKCAYFSQLLQRCNGRIAEAARMAGMTPQGFRKALRKLEIDNDRIADSE